MTNFDFGGERQAADCRLPSRGHTELEECSVNPPTRWSALPRRSNLRHAPARHVGATRRRGVAATLDWPSPIVWRSPRIRTPFKHIPRKGVMSPGEFLCSGPPPGPTERGAGDGHSVRGASDRYTPPKGPRIIGHATGNIGCYPLPEPSPERCRWPRLETR